MTDNTMLWKEIRKVADNRIKVKNLNGTADSKCTSCGSWISHWEHKIKEIPDKCCCIGCNNSAEVGAHVKKVNSEDKHHYIVPLCKTCNAKTDDFFVEKDILVTARKCESKS